MGKGSKNDSAWQRAFDGLNLLSQIQAQGHVYVSADELKAVGGREPRLMAKQDTLSARPAIFREQELTIFPVENGKYVIFRDPEQKSYFSLNAVLDDLTLRHHHSPCDLSAFETFPAHQRFSESQAIDFAFVASLLQTFLDDPALSLTIRGRLRSGAFQFQLPNRHHLIDVSGVQIEVDSGYESPRRVYLFEAKVGKRDDFHIRQLFYPYLEWSLRSRKEIVPVLLLYSNGQYYLLQFAFNARFGELSIVKKACYTINEAPLAPIHLAQLLEHAPPEAEPEQVPYPQADDLDKVVDIVQLLATTPGTKTQVAEYFEFESRQGDYYLNAAAYLGLIERDDHQFRLTPVGQTFAQTPFRAARTRAIVTQLVKRPTFRAIFQKLFERPAHLRLFETCLSIEDISTKTLVQIIQAHTSLNSITAARRARTVRSWLRWVLKNCELTA